VLGVRWRRAPAVRRRRASALPCLGRGNWGGGGGVRECASLDAEHAAGIKTRHPRSLVSPVSIDQDPTAEIAYPLHDLIRTVDLRSCGPYSIPVQMKAVLIWTTHWESDGADPVIPLQPCLFTQETLCC
jgi:hypothetical protein